MENKQNIKINKMNEEKFTNSVRKLKNATKDGRGTISSFPRAD